MTTKTGILAAAFSLLIISFSHAQDNTTPAKGQRRLGKGFGQGQKAMTPELRAQQFIKTWDKDGDGKLDEAELTAAFTEMKEKIQERRAEKSTPTPTPTPKPTP